jgi:uncharacterized membrane protein
MESIALLKQSCAIATIAIGLAGCFLLHFRQRSGPSLTFLVLVILLNAWLLSYNMLSGYALGGAVVPGIELMHQANDALVSVLSLLAAASFAIAMHRTASTSTPHRDSA